MAEAGISTYGEWAALVPEEIKGDVLWKMEVYRLGLFVADVGWQDITQWMKDRRTLDLSNQLYRALGSISANIAEGYSRGTGRDRARFYEYALGSARESRDWYYKSRYVLGAAVTQHRLALLTKVIRLLLTMIPQQRGQTLREHSVAYEVEVTNEERELAALLEDIPYAGAEEHVITDT